MLHTCCSFYLEFTSDLMAAWKLLPAFLFSFFLKILVKYT